MKMLGARLKEERKKLGLTQHDFAALGGIASNAQAHYESGERQPKAGYLIGIAAGGADVLYVLLGEHIPIAVESLNHDEATVLAHYRSLPIEDQRAFGRLSSSLSDCH